jgi:2,3-dimethylmalate lyase
MLRELLNRDQLLVVPGVYDGLSARIAQQSGFDALYMSGFCVAAGVHGTPDIGLVTATEMESAIARIKDSAPATPLIADADTGYGGPLNVARTVHRFERQGVACLQLEDQVHPKRCGHMDGKQVVDREEAIERIRIAVDTRSDSETLIMARTDARATHDLKEAMIRGEHFVAAGADILFIEAPLDLDEMATIGQAFRDVPLVANLVEDGKTPWVDNQTLFDMGFNIAMFPVSAILQVARTLQAAYSAIGTGEQSGLRMSFNELNSTLGLDDMRELVDSLAPDGP